MSTWKVAKHNPNLLVEEDTDNPIAVFFSPANTKVVAAMSAAFAAVCNAGLAVEEPIYVAPEPQAPKKAPKKLIEALARTRKNSSRYHPNVWRITYKTEEWQTAVANGDGCEYGIQEATDRLGYSENGLRGRILRFWTLRGRKSSDCFYVLPKVVARRVGTRWKKRTRTDHWKVLFLK